MFRLISAPFYCAAHLTYILTAFTLMEEEYSVSQQALLSLNVTWHTNW
jgi:hypothetical protein